MIIAHDLSIIELISKIENGEKIFYRAAVDDGS